MPDPIDLLERTIGSTGRVVAEVKPDQMDDATPCTDWTVRDLLNHVVGGMDVFAKAASGENSTFDFGGKPVDVIGDDPQAAFDETSGRCIAAWKQRGNLDGVVPLLGGESPAAMVWGINVGDTLVHGWDLARATGQDHVVDNDVVEAVWSSLHGKLPPEARGSGFGAEVTVPDDAPMIDRLVAYMGRTP
jgi:uncharacterized protein (TIGR03086 family)